MRILLIIHSLGPGGMERVMATIANYFVQKKKVQVDVLLCGRKREVFFELDSNINIHKPNFSFNNSIRTWHTIKTLIFIRQKVKSLKPDRILSFGEQWNNLVLLSTYGLKFPVFISDRSQPNKDLGKLNNFIRNRLYRRATGFIAQTHFAAENAKQNNWNENIQVIGNPIRQIIPQYPLKREKIVLAVGRLIDTKHFDKLIKHFKKIGNPHWKLVIVGGDAKKQNNFLKLKSLVKKLNAEKSIFLEGTKNVIDPYYLKSSIFAFSSSSEGFPNVIGEALSAGLPVVSFDCVAGPSEMIEDSVNGYLVPVMDFNAFQKKLAYLMENEDIREKMASRASESIKCYDANYICEKMYSFIVN